MHAVRDFQVILDVSNLPGGGSSYLAGDELAVWAENPAEVVNSVAAALGLQGSHLDAMFLLQKSRQGDKQDEEKSGAYPLPHDDGEDEEDEEEGLDCATFPLPNTYRTVLTRYVALYDKPSYEAIRALPLYAPEVSDVRKRPRLALFHGAPNKGLLHRLGKRSCSRDTRMHGIVVK
jgi:hypothetical protein